MRSVLAIAALCACLAGCGSAVSSSVVSEKSSGAVDLTPLPFYVRPGYDAAAARAIADGGRESFDPAGWQKVPGSTTGNRTVRVVNLDLVPESRRTFLSPMPAPPAQDFSFVTFFDMGPGFREEAAYVLHLGSIGRNWEIFVNGRLVDAEMHRDDRGRVVLPIYARGYTTLIEHNILRAKNNVLFFHIAGDPASIQTGLPIGIPQAVQPSSVQRELSVAGRFNIALISLYLFTGAFHLLFFFMRREERSSLHFGLFAITLFLFFFTRDRMAWDIITQHANVLYRLELGALFLTVPFFHAFLETILMGRAGRFHRINAGYHIVLVLAAALMPIPFVQDVLSLWQATVMVFLVAFIYFIVRAVYLEQRHASRDGGRPSLIYVLLRSVPGNILVGYAIITGTVIYDVIDAAYLYRNDGLTRFGFLVFVTGIAAVLSNRYISAIYQVESLNEELRRRVDELNQANREIRDSEERYRALIEESSDIIFTLDSSFCFTRSNRNMHRILGVSPERLRGMSILDLIYIGPEEGSDVNSRRLLQARLDEFASTRKPIFQKVQFRSSFLAEPKEMHVRLEYINLHGEVEIMGKASSVLEDNLLRYFLGERQRYVIGNSLITAEELSQRLVRNVSKYLDSQVLTGIRFGLREMLVNAIEHGNLNISYEDKTREILKGNYKDFIAQRQLDPRYRQRTVQVYYSLSARRALFLIRDEGDGFDHHKMRSRSQEELDEELATHGRGILMTETAFDVMRYNDRGNQVVLIKYFDPLNNSNSK